MDGETDRVMDDASRRWPRTFFGGLGLVGVGLFLVLSPSERVNSGNSGANTLLYDTHVPGNDDEPGSPLRSHPSICHETVKPNRHLC